MRKTNGWMAVVLLLVGLTFAGPAKAAGRGPATVDDLLQQLRILQAQVDSLEREAQGKKIDRRAMQAGLRDVDDRLERMEDQLRRLRRVEPVPAPMPMDDASFAALRRSVDRARFTSDKMNVIGAAASSQLFVVRQVLALLDEVEPSSAKLDALQILWPRVLDRQNSFLIYDSFPFSGDRQRARIILER